MEEMADTRRDAYEARLASSQTSPAKSASNASPPPRLPLRAFACTGTSGEEPWAASEVAPPFALARHLMRRHARALQKAKPKEAPQGGQHARGPRGGGSGLEEAEMEGIEEIEPTPWEVEVGGLADALVVDLLVDPLSAQSGRWGTYP